MPAPLPERIGRYRVQARIGRGAMGIVYAAFDEEAGREVAIKIMMADLEDEPETRARFLREAQAAGCLVHPNIISIFDMGEEEGRVYLVMERLCGQTLHDYLGRPQGTTLDEKIAVMMQVCDGLSTAHAHGVFHRDIKPGNLFVEDDGRLKILDFGVARLASSTMTASGYIIGTPDYMSPEQARGREIDQRSDIFSAGAVFYFMLTGRKPFAAHDLPSVLRKVQSEAPVPLTDAEAPPPLDQIVGRALAKDPAGRYQTMGEMLADLAAVRDRRESARRRLADERAARARDLETLRAEFDRLRAGFGLVAPASGAASSSGAGTAMGAVAASPGQAGEAMADLEAERGRLEAEIDRLRAARAALEVAERALSAGRPAEALPSLEQVARALPELPRAREALDRCRAALAETRRREARIEALVTEARGAMARGHWQEAEELAAQALAIDPGSPGAQAVRREAVAAAAEEVRRRAEQFAEAVRHADAAMAAGRLDEAAEEVGRARAVDPAQEAAIADLDSRLAAAREARAASEARTRRVSAAVSHAHHLFEAGSREEAVASLVECLATEPEAPGLADEIARLRAEAARLDEEERRREAARAELARAREALDQEDFAEAVSAAERALRLEDRLPEARRLMALAEVRQRERAEAAARSVRTGEFVARARRLVESGSLPRALREVARALAIDPSNADARTVEVQIHRLEAEGRARAAEAQQRRDRTKQSERLVKKARAAVRARRPEEARGLIAQALAIDPDHADALALSEQVARAAAVAVRAEDEDTVAQPAEADPDDTVTLAPQVVPSPGPGRPWGGLLDRLRMPRGRGQQRR